MSAQTGDKKPRGRPFQKGQSGNPRGRPAVARDFREKCRQWMEEKGGGWDQLIDLASVGKPDERLRAIQLIAAYAYGKPAQRLEHTDGDGGPLNVQVIVKDFATDDAA